MSIYETIKALGVPMDSHESDLYCKATPEAIEATKDCTTRQFFTHQVTGERWIDLPFAYQPWWDKRQQRRT